MAGQPLSPIPKAAKAEAPASPTEGALASMGDRTFWNHQPTSSSFPVTVLRMLGGHEPRGSICVNRPGSGAAWKRIPTP